MRSALALGSIVVFVGCGGGGDGDGAGFGGSATAGAAGANAGGSTTGGASTGATSAGGTSAGTTSSGGTTSAGGTSSGGTSSGGTSAGAPQGGSAQGGAAAGGTSQGGEGGASGSSTAGSGAAGAGGSSGSGGAGGSSAVGTTGCGNDPGATEEWLERSVDVDGETRTYFVYLPPGYDPQQAYPVVYQFHGCSDNRESNNVPVQKHSGAAAIHVRGRAVERCWDTGANGPDVSFFDAMVGSVEAEVCADPERRFASGYSSGAFMSHRLACVRGDMLRAVATIGGGQGGNGCAGSVGALIMHDSTDMTVLIPTSISARDAHLSRNACGDTTVPWSHDPCVEYQGCDAGLPVVWCETTGNQHGRQDSLTGPAFWDFFDSF